MANDDITLDDKQQQQFTPLIWGVINPQTPDNNPALEPLL